MKTYQITINLEDYLIAEFENSVILHGKLTDKVLLISRSVFVALSALGQQLYSLSQLEELFGGVIDAQVELVIKAMINEGLLK